MKQMAAHINNMKSKGKLGSGARFKALSAKLGMQGAHDPDALAAYIGRRKLGAKKFGQLAAKGR